MNNEKQPKPVKSLFDIPVNAGALSLPFVLIKVIEGIHARLVEKYTAFRNARKEPNKTK